MVFFPKALELVQLRQGGHIGHPVQKHLADQMIHFVLNADGVKAGGFDIQRLPVTVQPAHADHGGPDHPASQSVHAQTALPALFLVRSVENDFGIDELFGPPTEQRLKQFYERKAVFEAALKVDIQTDDTDFKTYARELAQESVELQTIVGFEVRKLSKRVGRDIRL